MSQYDIANQPEKIPEFCDLVAHLAIDHHNNGRTRKHFTGDFICRRFCSNWRGLHRRLASTIYNKTRDSLEIRDGKV